MPYKIKVPERKIPQDRAAGRGLLIVSDETVKTKKFSATKGCGFPKGGEMVYATFVRFETGTDEKLVGSLFVNLRPWFRGGCYVSITTVCDHEDRQDCNESCPTAAVWRCLSLTGHADLPEAGNPDILKCAGTTIEEAGGRNIRQKIVEVKDATNIINELVHIS